ncbi:MAG: MarR family winged helix-turn-helix transcriptional regulator [Alphaproteobacteria bacterium]|nr:MarR family winged helix-turn-helix transcriptional regulator [Alphaproteobacteria bacterium]
MTSNSGESGGAQGASDTETLAAIEEDPSAPFNLKPGQSIGYLTRDCYRNFSRTLERRIAKHGVKMGQWFFLRELWEEDGQTQRMLSERVGIMEPSTVVAIRGMIKDGLVKKTRDDKDKRKYRIELTAKGRRLKDRLLPYAIEVNEQATKGLSEAEIRQFRKILIKLKTNLTDESS